MITAAICALALLAPLPTAQPPSKQDAPFRGSNESPPRRYPSSGFTLDKLHGLPRTREVWLRPQPEPEFWVYPQYGWGYPTNQYGLGGYRPPGTGSYSNLGWMWFGR